MACPVRAGVTPDRTVPGRRDSDPLRVWNETRNDTGPPVTLRPRDAPTNDKALPRRQPVPDTNLPHPEPDGLGLDPWSRPRQEIAERVTHHVHEIAR